MRILAVVESSSWIEYHIIGSLTEMGHEVHRFSYGSFVGEFYGRGRRSERSSKNEALLRTARDLLQTRGLDLIFCYVYDDFLTVQNARQLARLGVPMVNLNVDMVNQWYRQLRTARFFSRILCAQKANMASLALYGARVLYFPMAARLPDEADEGSSDFVPDAPVTFLGTPMPGRVRLLAELERTGVPLAVYGKLWMENRHARPLRSFEKTVFDIFHYAWPRLRCEGLAGVKNVLRDRVPGNRKRSGTRVEDLSKNVKHGFLPDDAVASLFRRSAINLGFNRMSGDDPDVPGINQVKLRDFEVPLAGGFYLVEEAPDYAELFVPGKEVETWRTPAELVDKIRYYLSHEDERRAIAEAGRRRAMTDHTWRHRFEMLFDELNLR
jgi:spore maturation protein CgeB